MIPSNESEAKIVRRFIAVVRAQGKECSAGRALLVGRTKAKADAEIRSRDIPMADSCSEFARELPETRSEPVADLVTRRLGYEIAPVSSCSGDH